MANVTEAGDIILLALVLAVTVVVGLALLAVETFVGRVAERKRSHGGRAARRSFTRRR